MGLGGTPTSNGTGSTVLNVNATTGGSTIHLTNNTTGTTNSDGALLVQSGSDLLFINRESGNLKLRTADTDRLTIDSSGLVAIGSSSPSSYSASADDFVIATGATHEITDFLEESFSCMGLDQYQKFIRIDSDLFRPSEVPYLRGSANKAKTRLGWMPSISFEELVSRMVEHDIIRSRGGCLQGSSPS